MLKETTWIKILYSVIFLSYLFSHIDVGIFSQAGDEIKDSLGIQESDLGLLETALYIGVVCGTLICPALLMPRFQPKLIITLAALLNGLASIVVPLKPAYALLVLSRILTGIFLSVFLIYFPVWIDLKAPPHWQTMWICMFYFTEDLGMAVGYGLSSMFSAFNISWIIGFYIQAGSMACFIALMFLIIPGEHFESSTVDVGLSSRNYSK